MRIAIFSHSSSIENIGGAERALLELLDGWANFDPQLQVIVFARSPEGHLQPELRRRGITVHTYPFESWVLPEHITGVENRYRTLRDNSEFLSTAIEILEEFRPDYVVSNTVVSPWGALTAWKLGIPHFWFIHEYGTGHVFAQGIDETFEDISLLSRHVVASSESLKSYLETWIPTEQISVTYPLPEPEEFARRIALQEPIAAPKHPNDVLTAVNIGQFSEIKGQKLLLDAAAILQKQGFTINVVFVGRYSEQDQRFVEDFIQNHQLKGAFRFTGEIDEPFTELLIADIGVVTASSEGFGRATVEMLYAGLPVVASAAGATPELFQHARWNKLFEPGNPEALATAIAELIFQPELREQCSRESKQIAQELFGKHSKNTFYKLIADGGAANWKMPSRPPHFLRYWLAELTAAKQYMELVSANSPGTNLPDYIVGMRLMQPIRAVTRFVSGFKKRGKA